MRDLRILILDNEFPPLGGGTGVINYHVMAELNRYGHLRVDLVTSSRTKDQYEVESFGARGRVFKVPVDSKNIHHSSNIELLRYSFRGLRQALQLMHQQPYDLCWAYATVPAGFIAMALRLRTGLPYILITQGPDIPWYERRYYPIYPILLPIIKLIWHYAAVVTAQSEASRELIRKTSPRLPIKVIHNGVEIERFAPTPETLEQRGQRRSLTFACVGRLIERKGQQYLLQAAELLNHRGFSGRFRILLVGGGDNEGQLRHQCEQLNLQDVVTFVGVVASDQMPQQYAAADVFVLPSYNEGMSVALLEALAAALPVIVTETGGTFELVKDNGLIVPWAEPDALADALERFLREPELCRQMGRRSRRIAETFTWKGTAQAYLDLSYNCLSGSAQERAVLLRRREVDSR
jgi:phosphatidylinositol alpha-1,6-mannosyltransferase